MALIDSTTKVSKGNKCKVHEPVTKAVYSIFEDSSTKKVYLQVDTYGTSKKKVNQLSQTIQIELSNAVELIKALQHDQEFVSFLSSEIIVK